MSMKMKFGNKDIPFVYKGDKLVYPNPIKDGLLLWYDFKGMRNTDTNKEVAKDLSGNGNDGQLQNFNFTEESGYKDNKLVFDGVDDKLTVPELELDETSMTVMQDGKVYSYEDDKVLTVGEDGELIGGGVNLITKSNTVGNSWIGVDGKRVFNTGSESTGDFIRVFPGETLYLNRVEVEESATALPNYWRYAWFNDAGEFIERAANSTAVLDLQVPATANNLSISWAKGANPSVARHSMNTFYSPSSKDYKTTTLSPTAITDLQLYNKTLHRDELLHNAKSKGLKQLKPGVIVQDGLVLHYDFSNETNMSEFKEKAFDYSGNKNHGNLQNFGYVDGSGYTGGGLKFDGVDDEIVIPYENNLFSVDFTWSAVIKPYTVNKDMMFMYGSTTAQYFRIQNGKLGASVRGEDSPVAYALTSFALDANTAYHVVFSHTNGNYKIYANGEQVGESDRGMKNEKYRLSWLGKYTSSDPRAFDGEILSVQVHNKALSQEEIAHNYQIEKEKHNL